MIVLNKKNKIIIVLLAIILVTIGIVIILFVKNGCGNHMESDIEKSVKYKVTCNGSTIWAFHTIPKEVVNATKKYIKNNGYNSAEIEFNFLNSKYTYNPNYPSNLNDVPFVYYVGETYKNNMWVGYLAIDENGNVAETHDLMTAEELSIIQTDPDRGSIFAMECARRYLDLSSDISVETSEMTLYKETNTNKRFFCYMIKFKGIDDYIYINAKTGKIVK